MYTDLFDSQALTCLSPKYSQNLQPIPNLEKSRISCGSITGDLRFSEHPSGGPLKMAIAEFNGLTGYFTSDCG